MPISRHDSLFSSSSPFSFVCRRWRCAICVVITPRSHLLIYIHFLPPPLFLDSTRASRITERVCALWVVVDGNPFDISSGFRIEMKCQVEEMRRKRCQRSLPVDEFQYYYYYLSRLNRFQWSKETKERRKDGNPIRDRSEWMRVWHGQVAPLLLLFLEEKEEEKSMISFLSSSLFENVLTSLVCDLIPVMEINWWIASMAI